MADGESGKASPKLESTSHDSFSVLWYPSETGSTECSVDFKLNFLSTDFSYSKGVKGVPVRLCVKTDMRWPGSSRGKDRVVEQILASETCYCKVKLFRDHRAERNLSYDIANVRKSIRKIETQLADANTQGSDIHHRPGKRKRNDGEQSPISAAVKDDDTEPAEVPAWLNTSDFIPALFNTSYNIGVSALVNTSYQASSHPDLPDVESLDDLKTNLAALQHMLLSTLPTSVLNLRGEAEDDPDLFPVHLSQETLTEAEDPYRRSRGDSERQSVTCQPVFAKLTGQLSTLRRFNWIQRLTYHA
jgi:CP2 transcription factor